MNTSHGRAETTLPPPFLNAVEHARAEAQSQREYVDWIIAASPGWELRDVRLGPGHGGYGCTLIAGAEKVTILEQIGSIESAAVEAVEQMLERHGIKR